MKKTIQIDNAPAAIGPYSQAVSHADMVFTSGQIPLDPVSGEIVGDDISTQTRQVLENLTAVFKASAFRRLFQPACVMLDRFAPK